MIISSEESKWQRVTNYPHEQIILSKSNFFNRIPISAKKYILLKWMI
jgi:hypothetical protein